MPYVYMNSIGENNILYYENTIRDQKYIRLYKNKYFQIIHYIFVHIHFYRNKKERIGFIRGAMRRMTLVRKERQETNRFGNRWTRRNILYVTHTSGWSFSRGLK